jgi:HK97 family phage portal protein
MGLIYRTVGGTAITNETVLTIPPAWSAIRYISEGIASLGRGVFRRDPGGDVFPDHNSPVSFLVDGRPHPQYTFFDFLQTLVTNACLGNGYARIHFDPETARPYALELIPQEYVTEEYSRTGQLFYHVCGALNDQAVNIYLPHTEMIHIKGVSFTGVRGKRLSLVHQSAFSLGVNSAKYSETYFEKGATVGGILSFPNQLSKEQRDIINAHIMQHRRQKCRFGDGVGFRGGLQGHAGRAG